MSCSTSQNVIVIDNRSGSSGGPYTVEENTPNQGDVTVTDTSSGNSFVIPAPVFCVLEDCVDKDTSISLIEDGGALGGDKIFIKLDGITIGEVEFLGGHATGVAKWTLDGILDPMVFNATPINTAQRNNLPGIVAGYLIYNSDIQEYEYYDGTVWKALSATETITASNGLTKVVSDIQLGGTLGANTTVAIGSNTLDLTGTGKITLGDPSAANDSAWIEITPNPTFGGEVRMETNGIFGDGVMWQTSGVVGMASTAAGGPVGNGSQVLLQGNTAQMAADDGTGISKVMSVNLTDGPVAANTHASANDVQQVLSLQRLIQGVTAGVNGIGGEVLLQAEDANIDLVSVGSLTYIMTDVTAGAHVGQVEIDVASTGALARRVAIAPDQITLDDYGGGTITGTETFLLGVDTNGNVIEVTPTAASTNYETLTNGNFSSELVRSAGTPTVLANPAAGEYDFTIQASADIQRVDIVGDNTILNGSNELVISFDNSANSRDRKFNVQLKDLNNDALVDQQVTGTAHTQVVAGNVTTLTFPNMNGFGAAGYEIYLR